MGQYYMICNLDKQQYLHPHHCGDGLKLLEFGCSMNGTMTCLAVLLASGNNRGGGDLRSDRPIIGSWAGDRIVVAGDYADAELFGLTGQDEDGDVMNAYGHADLPEWTDVSPQAMAAICDDSYIRDGIVKLLAESEPQRHIMTVPADVLADAASKAKD